MEKGEARQEDPNLTMLRETGRCNIPIVRDGRAFVEILDQTRAYANELASQLGIKIGSNVRWFEETGHYLEVWDSRQPFKDD